MSQIEAIDYTAQRMQSFLAQLGLQNQALTVPSKDRKSLVVIYGEQLEPQLHRALPHGTFNNFPVLRVILPRLVK